jgi:hypothetical protein
MEEQCIVVFALIVTESASGLVGWGWRLPPATPTHTHSLAGSVTIDTKTTVHCSPGSSMKVTLKQRGNLKILLSSVITAKFTSFTYINNTVYIQPCFICLPQILMYCVGGCWGRTQDCCNVCSGSQSL